MKTVVLITLAVLLRSAANAQEAPLDAKFKGEWKTINVLWELKTKPPSTATPASTVTRQ